jgi:hypothetical protein
MDLVQKSWYFHHWIKAQQIDIEVLEEQADHIGYLSNPEFYQEYKKSKKNTVISSDEGFDEATKIVEDFVKNKPNNNASKKRRKVRR